MRQAFKTANRLDNLWTAFVMMPALVLAANAGIAMYQGKATPADLGRAGQQVAAQFGAQYLPYVETTSGAILTGVEKAADLAGTCLGGGNGGPVYLNGSMASRNGCGMISSVLPARKITPYRTYR